MKLPAFQFYTGDYIKATRHLSLAARGAWVDILCAMNGASKRGEATFENMNQFARVLGCEIDEAQRVFISLTNDKNPTKKPVASCKKHGDGSFTLTSRRMKKDEKIRKIRAKAGRLGGNPNLLKQKSTTNDNQKTTPSSAICYLQSASSSSDTSADLQRGRKPKAGAFRSLTEADLADPEKMIAWHAAQAKKRKPVIGSSDEDRLLVIAAAVMASRGNTPIGLFGDTIAGKKWERITHEDEKEANRLIGSLQKAQSGFGAELVGNFKRTDSVI